MNDYDVNDDAWLMSEWSLERPNCGAGKAGSDLFLNQKLGNGVYGAKAMLAHFYCSITRCSVLTPGSHVVPVPNKPIFDLLDNTGEAIDYVTIFAVLNQCLFANPVCEQICIQDCEFGTFTCTCYTGYEITGEGFSCTGKGTHFFQLQTSAAHVATCCEFTKWDAVFSRY